MQEQLQHLESSTIAETYKQAERPVLRALPSIRQDSSQTSETRSTKETHQAAPKGTSAAEKFDARAFVFTCLEKNPDLKLAEIEQLALATGKELSQPTANLYRKQFFDRNESPRESSSMKAESPGESATMKAHGIDESSVSSERRVVS